VMLRLHIILDIPMFTSSKLPRHVFQRVQTATLALKLFLHAVDLHSTLDLKPVNRAQTQLVLHVLVKPCMAGCC
jgi:hypothetical protein